MGDAQRKLLAGAQTVRLDIDALGLHIVRSDRLNLEVDPRDRDTDPVNRSPEKVAPRAFALLARTAVAAAFPQGMTRADGKIWAAWEDLMEEELQVLEVTRAQIEWLWKRLNDESVRLPVTFSRWREAAADGIDAVLRPPAAQEATP